MIWGRTNVNSSVQPTGQVNTSVGEVEGGKWRGGTGARRRKDPKNNHVQLQYSVSFLFLCSRQSPTGKDVIGTN